jgi:hypothetical protein
MLFSGTVMFLLFGMRYMWYLTEQEATLLYFWLFIGIISVVLSMWVRVSALLVGLLAVFTLLGPGLISFQGSVGPDSAFVVIVVATSALIATISKVMNADGEQY